MPGSALLFSATAASDHHSARLAIRLDAQLLRLHVQVERTGSVIANSSAGASTSSAAMATDAEAEPASSSAELSSDTTIRMRKDQLLRFCVALSRSGSQALLNRTIELNPARRALLEAGHDAGNPRRFDTLFAACARQESPEAAAFDATERSVPLRQRDSNALSLGTVRRSADDGSAAAMAGDASTRRSATGVGSKRRGLSRAADDDEGLHDEDSEMENRAKAPRLDLDENEAAGTHGC